MTIKKTHKNKNGIVKESNKLARATLTPQPDSVWIERIIAYTASLNRIDDKNFISAEFKIGQLTSNISTLQRREIKKAIERLTSMTYTFYKNRDDYWSYSIFDYIRYNHGEIYAKFNKSMKPFFLQLTKEFSLRSLPEFNTLTSIYGQQLYRFLTSWSNKPNKTVTLDELYQLTNAPSSFRRDFTNFRARVLEPAKKEINAKTSLKFDWEPIKTGRKVTAIRFIFGELGIKNLEKNRHTAEKKTEKEILLELQTEAIRCWEKHHAQAKTCNPRKTVKRCKYCQTRGKMSTKTAAHDG